MLQLRSFNTELRTFYMEFEETRHKFENFQHCEVEHSNSYISFSCHKDSAS